MLLDSYVARNSGKHVLFDKAILSFLAASVLGPVYMKRLAGLPHLGEICLHNRILVFICEWQGEICQMLGKIRLKWDKISPYKNK